MNAAKYGIFFGTDLESWVIGDLSGFKIGSFPTVPCIATESKQNQLCNLANFHKKNYLAAPCLDG